MAELKTKPTQASVQQFVKAIGDEQQRKDCALLVKLMKEVTGAQPKMWGPSIVGFGDCHCVYASGRECDWFSAGFSPRKGTLTLYLMAGMEQHVGTYLKKLGKAKIGKCCLYIKKLADVDLAVLRELLQVNQEHVAQLMETMGQRAEAKKSGKKK